MKDITRTEAAERASVIQDCHYEIFLDLTKRERFFSRTCVKFNSKPGANTFIDALANAIESVSLNGIPLDIKSVFDGSRIALENLETDNGVVVEGYFEYTNTGEGMHEFTDPVDNETYLYTQCEVSDARRIFAVFEQPDIKASFIVSTKVPKNWHVISNSTCREIKDESNNTTLGTTENCPRVWNFGQTPKMSSYLFAIAAGPYVGTQSVYKGARSIPLGIYCRKSMNQYLDADYIFDITRSGFEYYEKRFSHPFPFEKYDQVFLPEYNMGAMENIGCVTLSENYIFRGRADRALKERRVVTILHELAHMWFGNLVTMRWWNDLWLNESFAEIVSTMASERVTEYKDAWATFALTEKSWAYVEDQLPTTHPVVADVHRLSDVYSNFDGITYAKGASVLKQLVHWIGEEKFYEGLNRYFRKYAYGNATLKDLLTELSSASGQTLDEWSKQWLETPGVNAINAKFCVKDGKFDSFSLEQDGPQRSHRINIGLYNLESDVLKKTIQTSVLISGAKTAVRELVGIKQPNLILLNDKDYGYCKVRFDIQSMDCILENLSKLKDPLSRSIIWCNLWLNVRDCLIDPSLFVETFVRHVESEQDTKWILERVNKCINFYTKDDKSTKASIAEKVWLMFERAQPNSDNQLQFLKGYALFCSTKMQYERLLAILTGKCNVVQLDADLEWHIIAALAAGDYIDEDEINNFEKKDNTITGRELSARARAALPNKKADCWQKILTDRTLSNSTIRSISAGFQFVQSADQLSPFVDVYFDNVLDIFKNRTFAIASAISEGMFPLRLSNTDLVQKTKSWLRDNKDAPVGLRRIITDNLHEAEIAVKLKECFT